VVIFPLVAVTLLREEPAGAAAEAADAPTKT